MAFSTLPHELTLGIPEIDEQHRQLFALVEALREACAEGKPDADVNQLFDTLEQEVVVHFDFEEELQRKHRYPLREVHLATHDGFIRDLVHVRGQFESAGNPRAVLLAAIPGVMDWLAAHVKTDDRESANFLRSKL